MSDEELLAVFILSGGKVMPQNPRGLTRAFISYPNGAGEMLHPDSVPFALRNWYTQVQSGMEFQHFGAGYVD